MIDDRIARTNLELHEAIRNWMVAKIAEVMQIEPGSVDIRQHFLSYGLDSIVLFSLTGHLAECFGCELPATLLWEYPTIETLAQHMAQEPVATT